MREETRAESVELSIMRGPRTKPWEDFHGSPYTVDAADTSVGASESPTQFESPGGFLQPMCVSGLSDFEAGRQS